MNNLSGELAAQNKDSQNVLPQEEKALNKPKPLKSRLTRFRVFGLYSAIVLVMIALAGLFSTGLNLGLDFTGGYLTEFSTNSSISQADMQKKLVNYLPEGFSLSSANNGTEWTVRQIDSSAGTSSPLWLNNFVSESSLVITPEDSIYIGSQVGEELINQGGLALLTAIIIVLLYLSFRFEWRLALGAVAALFHDVLLVLGCFAWFGISFDLTVLASILAIIGYSLNDSIIVGDKVRELLKSRDDRNLDQVINSAIKSTLTRTLVTSGTTLATIGAIWFFAGDSLQGFSVALFIGILVGTFSSMAIAATIPQLLGLQRDHYLREREEVCQLP